MINTILVITNNIKLLDNSVYQLIFSFRNQFLDTFFITITKLGNTSTVIITILIFLIFLSKEERKILLTGTISTVSINSIIKKIIKRPRPDHLRLIKQGGYSYPSGHTMISIAVYGFLLYLVYKKVKSKKVRIILSTLLVFIIILIGMSRIYVGVHYPSDVIGGYLLATVIQILVIVFFQKLGGKSNDKNDSK